MLLMQVGQPYVHWQKPSFACELFIHFNVKDKVEIYLFKSH